MARKSSLRNTRKPRRNAHRGRRGYAVDIQPHGESKYRVTVTRGLDGQSLSELVAGGIEAAESYADSLIREIEFRNNPRRHKTKTPEQLRKMQEKAVRFLRDVVKDPDKADEIEEMDLDEYARRKKITLTNPRPNTPAGKRRATVKSAKANPGGKNACKSYSDKCVPASQMAFVGDPGHPTTWALRVDNANHVRDALSRFSHTRKIPRKYRRAVAEELHKYAKKFGINDKVFAAKYLGKRNPESEAAQAEKLYETFHQEPPREVLEFNQEIYRPKDYTVLGELIELRLRWLELKRDFEGEDVMLASNAAGTQMYFIGGNQDLRDVISEAGEKIDQSKDFLFLGEIDGIVYRARKEFTNFEVTDWDHNLGEHGHKRPVLMYDKLNREMMMVGGEYQVKYEGIIH